MVKDSIGIINNVKNDIFLKEITHKRTLASVPIGGRYRVIDFVLSNMVNSGIQNIGILLQDKYRSFMDHIRSGKEWGLDRKRDGLFILPPVNNYGESLPQGDLENFYNNLSYLRRTRQKYVLISGCGVVCNIDYRPAFDFYHETGADIVILYNKVDPKDTVKDYAVLDIDAHNRVKAMEMIPVKIKDKNVSMETYIMKKSLLIDLINECMARGEYDFTRDAIIKNVRKTKIYAYQHKGYVARIHSVQSYYKHNMDLLIPEIWKELFFSEGLIYTKVKDQAPAKYMENAKVTNALVANECVIAGNVENSVIFRGVNIRKGALVKNSIIMEKCDIGENSILENVILDKEVEVTSDKKLVGVKEYPIVVEKKAVI